MKQAPDFKLKDETGKEVTLADLLAKGPILIAFYPGDFTPVCTKQLCNYRDSKSSFEGLGIQVVGISGDTPESHAKFKTEYHIPYTLLSDPKNEVAKRFGCTSKLLFGLVSRGVYIVDQKGMIQYEHVEPTPLTRRSSEELTKAVEGLKAQNAI